MFKKLVKNTYVCEVGKEKSTFVYENQPTNWLVHC